MPAGVVKWFDKRKGWGFIREENGHEVFVHFSQSVAQGFRSLSRGDPVSFDLGQTARGIQAENVIKLEPVWRTIED